MQEGGQMREVLGELKAEIRGLREDVAEAKIAAKSAKDAADATDKKLEAMKNRGYGFLGGAMFLAGAAGSAAGAKLQTLFFGGH